MGFAADTRQSWKGAEIFTPKTFFHDLYSKTPLTMSFFGLQFGQNADIDIILENQDERKMGEIKDENGRKERMYLFYDGESVTGKVNVTLHRKTNRFEHQGIRIEFIGQIELYYDRGNHHEFLSLAKELARPGELTQNTSFDFEFNQVEKPYECYTGANVRLRYFIRVTIVRRLSDMTKEMDLLVHTLATYPEMNNPIKMEVGIEECLHIEFEYNKSKYHLKDVIVGKIYFLLVRIKIRYMEVAIIKRETTGSGPNTFHDNETIAKYEIMDGAPVKGESIPIRVFLAGYNLTPTMRDINKKFSVRYYLNLVLVDEEDRRDFKQQEITLWRKVIVYEKVYYFINNKAIRIIIKFLMLWRDITPEIIQVPMFEQHQHLQNLIHPSQNRVLIMCQAYHLHTRLYLRSL